MLPRLIATRRARRRLVQCLVPWGVRVLPLILMTLVAACYGFRAGTLSPGQRLDWSDQVRVTLTSGQVVSLLHARVERDTLIGPPLYGRMDSIARYPVATVRAVEVRQLDTAHTITVVVGAVAAAALFVAVSVVLAFRGFMND